MPIFKIELSRSFVERQVVIIDAPSKIELYENSQKLIELIDSNFEENWEPDMLEYSDSNINIEDIELLSQEEEEDSWFDDFGVEYTDTDIEWEDLK